MTPRTDMMANFTRLLALSTLWGASYSFIKVGVETIPPLALITARTLIAGGLLVLILHWRGLRLPRDRQTWGRFAVQACLNCALPFTLIAWAQQTTDAGLATILNSTTPIFAFLLTALVIRHEAVTPRKLFGVCAGLVGICLVIGFNALGGLGQAVLPQLAILAASVCYAGAAIFGKTFANVDPMLTAAGSLICGAAMLLPISLMVDQPWTLRPSTSSVMALLALSVFSTALAFVIYFRLVQTLGSVGTTAQAYLRVPIGVGIGVAFLDETLSTTAWIGMGCVIVGVAAMSWPSRRAD
jgi:drug/metabolite transporter (DMT)-like permease